MDVIKEAQGDAERSKESSIEEERKRGSAMMTTSMVATESRREMAKEGGGQADTLSVPIDLTGEQRRTSSDLELTVSRWSLFGTRKASTRNN